jgi:iron complex transport system ATP-binding protein
VTAFLRATGLSVRLGGRLVLDGVSLEVGPGQWLGVIGPNGAGKSTLIRALSGLVRAGGSVTVDGESSLSLGRRQLARLMAIVPQSPVMPPGMSVHDYVLLGRTPHLGPLAREGAADLAAVHRLLVELDLLSMADRALHSLSGGERQRAVIARALAQEAPILLLDEPTTALDIGHQQEVLDLVDSLRQQRELAVLSTMHDLTLAGRYADRLMLLDDGRSVAEGLARDVLTEDNLARFYRANVRLVIDEDGLVVVVPVKQSVAMRRPPTARRAAEP